MTPSPETDATPVAETAAQPQVPSVKVTCGTVEKSFPNLVGQTIGQVRQNQDLLTALGADRNAKVRVNGQALGFLGLGNDTYVLRAGDILDFYRPTGQKG